MSLTRQINRPKFSEKHKGKMPTHIMIARTAKEMAMSVYEDWAMQNNGFYKENRSIEDYANEAWPLFVEPARATLAKLLTSNINEDLKKDISDALIADNTLRQKRRGANLPQFAK